MNSFIKYSIKSDIKYRSIINTLRSIAITVRDESHRSISRCILHRLIFALQKNQTVVVCSQQLAAGSLVSPDKMPLSLPSEAVAIKHKPARSRGGALAVETAAARQQLF